jgi:hypothetical protein
MGTLLFGAAAAQANWSNKIDTERDSGIDIMLSSPIDTTPESGFVPVTIAVRNHSNAAHTWDFHSNSDRYNGRNGVTSLSLDSSIEVASGQASRVRLLAPVVPTDGAVGPSQVVMTITGYGVGNGNAYFPAAVEETLPILVSDTLDAELWAALRTKLTKGSKSSGPAGSLVDLKELGSDWRALLGFQSFWLTTEDYDALDPATQAAIRDWVAQGGQLYLCADSPDPGVRAAFGFADASAERAAHGGGEAHWVSRGSAPDLAMTVITSGAVSPGKRLVSSPAKGNRLVDSLGRLRLNFPLLMTFIVLFALLVGPVNLFWIAGAERRPRLFWTTPAISVGASLLLLVLIFWEDGFGGMGHRIAVVQLLPAEQKEVIKQEQATLTGVLLSTRFGSMDDLFLAQLPITGRAPGDCRQSGHAYDGGWFASRRVQAQLVEAILPTRAEVQLLNARAAGDGALPEITSTIASTLDTIVYVDSRGASWQGRNLHTGERQTLEHGPPGNSLFVVPEADGDLIGPMVAGTARRPGYFYAASGDGPFIATLPSIRWNMQKAVYTGPVTIAP